MGRLAVLLGRTEITEQTWEDLEDLLLGADVGASTTDELLRRLRARFQEGAFTTGEALQTGLQEELVELLSAHGEPAPLLTDGLTAVLVIGVNGAGKTTSIAKLGNYWRVAGRRVLLGAADTFRAAGVEQLEVWAERLGLPCVGAQTGGDPGAVAFDAISSAKARDYDLVVIDTAGRLQTKSNLMEELRKIRRVVDRQEVACRSLLVLDATFGQNAVVQARSFADVAGLDGVVLAKLDGTAKGGVVFSIVRDLGVPVRFLGTGETVDDLVEFDPGSFVSALFSEEA
jgi:fused signal recognition particle receptor